MEEAAGIGRTVTVKSNKAVLKDYQGTAFSIQLHKVMATALKESLSEKDMKEIISKVASLCI